jgi:MSHA biogenesis protein MshP
MFHSIGVRTQRQSSPKSQRGSTIVVALIISIVLLGLGIALSNQISSTVRQQSIEYYGARAYLSAQSALEVAISRVVSGGNPQCSVVTAPVSFNTANMQNCSVSLSCDVEINVDEPEVSGGAIRVYSLGALAACSSGQLNTSRELLVEIRQEE